MSHLMPAGRESAGLAWLLPILLALAGCGLVGRNRLADDKEGSSEIEVAAADPAATEPAAENRAISAEKRVAQRTSWQLPDDARISMPPIQAGPIIPVSGQTDHRETASELEQAEQVPPRQQSEADQTLSPTPPTPRPSAASPAPLIYGSVDKVGADDFREVVLDSEVPVLVDFYADWCGPCKRLSPMLDQIARERTDVRVVKVNIDHDKQLAKKYGVSKIPTMIIFKDGNLVAQHTGLPNIQKVLER